MKIENPAEEFMLSPNYISIYIKKQTGFSIQQHIIQHKLKTAEKLLLQSHYNISELPTGWVSMMPATLIKYSKRTNKCHPLSLKERLILLII